MVRGIYEEVVRIQQAGGAAALATVVGTQGSTPGKSAMKMLVWPDGRTLGSVGGGSVEAETIERCREVVKSERPQRFSLDLNARAGHETGPVCGGRIEIFIEPIVMPTVFVFGGGHVGRAVCAVGPTVGFRFVVVDDRAEFVTDERFGAAAERIAAPWSTAIRELEVGADSYVLVMTRGHVDDSEVLRELAAKRVAPRYLGLIGSKTKALTVRRQLLDEGVAPEFLDRVKTPIGLDIGAETAEEIAIAVLAELIQIRRQTPAASP